MEDRITEREVSKSRYQDFKKEHVCGHWNHQKLQ